MSTEVDQSKKFPPKIFSENNSAWKVFQNKGLHFGHVNINSILSKIEQLISLLTNSNISVLWITETQLDNTANNAEVKIDGYNLIRSDKNKV